MAGALVLMLAWLYAFRATLGYAWALFTAETYRTNLYVLLAALVLIAVRSRKPPLRRLEMRTAPLLMIAAALIANVILVRVLDVRTLAIAAFGAGTYGVLGLYLEPAAWRRGLAGALLVVLALPFGDQASTYLGFSARVFTAKIVEARLSACGVTAVSSSSVLALESGVAYVDVPCSGIKSLWTGAIFFFGATYFERVRLDHRWLASALGFFAAVLAANVARVLAIVVLAVVLELPRAADILHEPLGVLGFAVACAFGVWLLRLVRKDSCPEDQGAVRPPSSPRAQALLIATTIAVGIFAARAPSPSKAIDLAFELPFPTNAIALTDAEAGLLGRVGESAMKKLHFDTGALSGTALILATERWRAHHPPEICLASSGAKIGAIQELELSPGHRARLIDLDEGARTALYFYASHGETTGDIVERIFADVFAGDRSWVMVSILIDRPVRANDPALKELFEQFRRGVKS